MTVRALRRIGWRELCWLAAGLFLVVAMRKSLPSYEEQLAAVPVPAVFGRRVVTRDFAVTVDGFRLAHAYRTASTSLGGGEEQLLKTPGIWMAVPLKIEMLREPGIVGARLRTRDGLLYRSNSDQRPGVRGVNIAGQQLLPGLPRSGAFFFELPPEKLPGAHLELYSGTLPPSLDAVVDVDLGSNEQSLSQVVDEVDLRP